MSEVQIGEIMALGTACCWAMSSLLFETASRRAGSLPVNLIRLCIAFLGLTLIGIVGPHHRAIPTEAPRDAWMWLLLSGVVGFFIGDLTLFRAFVEIGARLATLLQSTAPIMAALTTYIFLNSMKMTAWSWVGMFVTLAGIVSVIVERIEANDPTGLAVRRATTKGIVLGLLGAFGQGVGAVLTARGLVHFRGDPYAATQIRAIAGICGFAVLILILRDTRRVVLAIRDRHAFAALALGAIFGPLLGVSLFTNSLAHGVSPGVAQTLSSLVPIIIIPFLVVLGRERVTWRAAIGAGVAVAGVAILLW
jgi:drug/metabolite transporter (DMT)-like permease